MAYIMAESGLSSFSFSLQAYYKGYVIYFKVPKILKLNVLKGETSWTIQELNH